MYSRFITIEGDTFERGVQEGTLLHERILANYVNQKRHYQSTSGYDFDEWAKTCLKYVPILEKYAPDTLEEIKGVAVGAHMPLGEVLALTTAYEKAFGCENIKDLSDKCTSFSAFGGATKDGLMICGQTNDERMDEFAPELDVTLHHKDKDGNEMMIYTHPGIPAYMGCNNHGLAVLWTYIDNGLRQDGVPTCVIIREALSKHTYEEAVEYIQNIPHAIPNYFKVCSRDKGATGMECFPNRVYTEVSGETSAHANHNLFEHDEPDTSLSWSTRQRVKNMNRLLAENYGRIDAEIAMEFFRDHTDFPYSICTHPNCIRPMAKSLAAQVYDLSHGKMYITHGCACENPYHEYSFDTYKG